jgi:hypothetical protein
MMCADFRPHAPLAIAATLSLAAFFSSLPAHAESSNHCARYGADYVAVAGSNGCVKIGGHVRVDMARQQAMGYASLSDGVQHASSLQPMAPFGLNDLFPR